MPPVRYESLTVVVGFMLNSLGLVSGTATLMVLRLASRITAFTRYFLSRPGIFVPVKHPLAKATNFYGIDYSEIPVHGGRTIMQ